MKPRFLVHERAYPRPCGAHQLGQGFLAHLLDNDGFLFSILTKVGKQQEDPGQSLLTRVEQLIDQVFLEPNVAREQVDDEPLSEGRMLMQDLDHRRFLDPQQGDIRDGRRGRDPARLPSQTSLAKEITGPQQADDGRFPSMRHYGQLDPARPDKEHGIGRGPLREDALALAALHQGSPRADLREKRFHIEPWWALRCHDVSSGDCENGTLTGRSDD